MVKTVSESKDNAYLKGEVYTFPVLAVDPTGDEDYFAHIINNGREPIELDRARFSTTVVGLVTIQRVTGTAAGGQTAVKQVNNKTGAEALVENVIASTDPDITGLSPAGTQGYLALGVVLDDREVVFDPPIRLSQGEQLALLWGEATGVLTGTIDWRKVTEPQDLV